MERIVMAVSTGLDIIPALGEAARGGRDPVSEDLERIVALAEGGTPVDDAIRGVSENSPSPAVKHALIHLRLAHQQGGELVRPLKELSDATQTAYQELVEEEIAKLPVKAVMPLMLTFAGLIVCFLTVPFIQVGVIASKVTHAAR
jgi:pilus assembly protein TadC